MSSRTFTCKKCHRTKSSDVVPIGWIRVEMKSHREGPPPSGPHQSYFRLGMYCSADCLYNSIDIIVDRIDKYIERREEERKSLAS